MTTHMLSASKPDAVRLARSAGRFIKPSTPQTYQLSHGRSAAKAFWPVRSSGLDQDYLMLFIDNQEAADCPGSSPTSRSAEFIETFIKRQFPEGVPVQLVAEGLLVVTKEHFVQGRHPDAFMFVPVYYWNSTQMVFNYTCAERMAKHLGITELSLVRANSPAEFQARAKCTAGGCHGA